VAGWQALEHCGELLVGDPWEGCQDIAREGFLEWCQDFVRAHSGGPSEDVEDAEQLLLEEGSPQSEDSLGCCGGGRSESLSFASTASGASLWSLRPSAGDASSPSSPSVMESPGRGLRHTAHCEDDVLLHTAPACLWGRGQEPLHAQRPAALSMGFATELDRTGLDFAFSSALRPCTKERDRFFGSALRPCGHWPSLAEVELLQRPSPSRSRPVF